MLRNNLVSVDHCSSLDSKHKTSKDSEPQDMLFSSANSEFMKLNSRNFHQNKTNRKTGRSKFLKHLTDLVNISKQFVRINNLRNDDTKFMRNLSESLKRYRSKN